MSEIWPAFGSTEENSITNNKTFHHAIFETLLPSAHGLPRGSLGLPGL